MCMKRAEVFSCTRYLLSKHELAIKRLNMAVLIYHREVTFSQMTRVFSRKLQAHPDHRHHTFFSAHTIVCHQSMKLQKTLDIKGKTFFRGLRRAGNLIMPKKLPSFKNLLYLLDYKRVISNLGLRFSIESSIFKSNIFFHVCTMYLCYFALALLVFL